MAQRHGTKPGRVIGLVGHPYCLYDSFVNTGILRFLQEEGCRLLTSEMLPEGKINAALKGLPKAIYWTMGRLALGASRLFARTRASRTGGRGGTGGRALTGSSMWRLLPAARKR